MECSKCKRELDESYFYPRKNRKKKLSSWCKDCLKAHRDKYSEKARDIRRERMFGVSGVQYQIMFNNQKGKCKICGKHQSEIPKSLCVDHDHATGKIRGLLCDDCNVGLGRFKDNVDNLKNAIKYLI